MKIQNKGAVLVQIAPLFISQPRNQNQSICWPDETLMLFFFELIGSCQKQHHYEAKSITSVPKMVSQPIFNRDIPNYLTMTKYITYVEYCLRALRAKQNNRRTMALHN